MQDSLTSSFRWGETFDTAPLCQRLLYQGFNGDGHIGPPLQRATRHAVIQRATRSVVVQ